MINVISVIKYHIFYLSTSLIVLIYDKNYPLLQYKWKVCLIISALIKRFSKHSRTMCDLQFVTTNQWLPILSWLQTKHLYIGSDTEEQLFVTPSEQVPDYQSLQYGHFGVQSLARPPKRFLLKLINLIFTSWPIWSSPNPIFIGNLTGVPLCLNAILLMAHFSATFATMLTAVWYQI